MVRVITQAPCTHCPFRKDRPIYLRRSRRIEIAEALLSGGSFHCHATVEQMEDDDGENYQDTTESLLCAGAEKSLAAKGLSSQMGRIADRLGLADTEAVVLRGPEVWDIYEWQRLAEGATADDPEVEEVETCSVVNENCLAPAGYAVGGGVIEGDEAAGGRCPVCDEPVCENCSNADGVCDYCAEEEAGQ